MFAVFRYVASYSLRVFRTDHDLLTVAVIDCIQLGHFVLRPSRTMTCVRKISPMSIRVIIAVGIRFLKIPWRCVRWGSKFDENAII